MEKKYLSTHEKVNASTSSTTGSSPTTYVTVNTAQTPEDLRIIRSGETDDKIRIYKFFMDNIPKIISGIISLTLFLVILLREKETSWFFKVLFTVCLLFTFGYDRVKKALKLGNTN